MQRISRTGRAAALIALAMLIGACAPEAYDGDDLLFSPPETLDVLPLEPAAPALEAAAARAAAPDPAEDLDARGAALRQRADALRSAP